METSMLLSIFIGVVSGVLTTLILFGSGQLLNKIIIPWYRKMKYIGLDISGQWFESHNYEDILLQESSITIYQNAEKIKGEIILIKKHIETNKEIEAKIFYFHGAFYNNFLNITCWNKDKKKIGIHNYLMNLRRDGGEMEGIKTYYDIGTQEIRAESVYWSRNNK